MFIVYCSGLAKFDFKPGTIETYFQAKAVKAGLSFFCVFSKDHRKKQDHPK